MRPSAQSLHMHIEGLGTVLVLQYHNYNLLFTIAVPSSAYSIQDGHSPIGITHWLMKVCCEALN